MTPSWILVALVLVAAGAPDAARPASEPSIDSLPPSIECARSVVLKAAYEISAAGPTGLTAQHRGVGAGGEELRDELSVVVEKGAPLRARTFQVHRDSSGFESLAQLAPSSGVLRIAQKVRAECHM